MAYQMVPTPMILNDLEDHFSCLRRFYISENTARIRPYLRYRRRSRSLAYCKPFHI